jgi:hypothetical protein
MSTTLTIQPCLIDTYIESSNATTNYGTDNNAYIGEKYGASTVRRMLIKFDLTDLPANAAIISATLSLYCIADESNNARTCRVYRVKRDWSEAQATWTIWKTSNNWSTAGGFHANDCEQTDIGTRAFSATETLNEFKAFTLTPTTKADLDLGNGWLIKMDTESDDAYQFTTREGTAANRPKLVIVYTTYQDMTAAVGAQTVVTGNYAAMKVHQFTAAVGAQTVVTGAPTRLALMRAKDTAQTVVKGNFAGGTTVYDIPETEALQIYINGLDYTPYTTIDAEGLVVENALTSRMDTATVTLAATSPDERLALDAIVPWQEIIISRVLDGIVRFAGYIVGRRLLPFGGPQDAAYHVLTCQDYSSLLQRTHVNAKYTSKTDAYIVGNLIATYAPDFNGITYVTSSKTIDTITFNRISIFDALQQLCGVTGYEWYVDENKCVHYFSDEATIAPYALSDSGEDDCAPYQSFTYQEDASQVKNRVFVYGGTYLSASFSETFIGDASRKIWSLAYTPAATPVITVDAASMLEGIDGVDNPANVDVLCNNTEKLIKFTNAPANTAVILVTYQYSIPILVRVRKQTSYDTYGKWFDYKIIDRDITSTEEATAAASAILEADAFSRETVSIVTPVIGYRSGQVAKVINGAIGLDGFFLIQRVSARLISAVDWSMEYAMEMGEWHGDVVDLLRRWQQEHGPQMETRDDEQLNEYLDNLETLTLTDAVACISQGSSSLWDGFNWDAGVWS